ncbi:MAG: formylaminopyrimidine deformylase / aminopyrimidine aminohydrolase, partial [Frankiaceae bacterium]|nr:formylaminopyrimidine deformylase / aminopyrimidine aminohydrolase [Frankiaceae bacterium]
PAAAFDRWIVADHAFVVAFRRFVGGLMVLAPDEAARDQLAGSIAALQPELELFRAAARERGLDLDAEPQLTELGYSSYLLSSLLDGWPTALAVLYGAEKAYVDAWTAVRAQASTESAYWSFIDNWSSARFGEWVEGVGRLVDGIPAAGRPAAHLAFRRVVRFERAFWDAVHEPTVGG